MPPKKTIKYTLSQKKDKSNTKLFFLANKKTDFFETKTFSQISENLTLRSRFFLLPGFIQK